MDDNEIPLTDTATAEPTDDTQEPQDTETVDEDTETPKGEGAADNDDADPTTDEGNDDDSDEGDDDDADTDDDAEGDEGEPGEGETKIKVGDEEYVVPDAVAAVVERSGAVTRAANEQKKQATATMAKAGVINEQNGHLATTLAYMLHNNYPHLHPNPETGQTQALDVATLFIGKSEEESAAIKAQLDAAQEGYGTIMAHLQDKIKIEDPQAPKTGPTIKQSELDTIYAIAQTLTLDEEHGDRYFPLTKKSEFEKAYKGMYSMITSAPYNIPIEEANVLLRSEIDDSRLKFMYDAYMAINGKTPTKIERKKGKGSGKSGTGAGMGRGKDIGPARTGKELTRRESYSSKQTSWSQIERQEYIVNGRIPRKRK